MEPSLEKYDWTGFQRVALIRSIKFLEALENTSKNDSN